MYDPPLDQSMMTLMIPVSDIANIQTQKRLKQTTANNEDARLVQKGTKEKTIHKTPDEPKEKRDATEKKPKSVESKKEHTPPEPIKQEKVEKSPPDKPTEKQPLPAPKVEKSVGEKKVVKKENIVEKVAPKKNKKVDNMNPFNNLESNTDKASSKIASKPEEDLLTKIQKTLDTESHGTKDKSKTRTTETDTPGNANSKGQYDSSKEMTLSEMTLIRTKIEKFWHIEGGVHDIQNFRANLHIKLKFDRSLESLSIIDYNCPPSVNCDALMDNVKRAVHAASPFDNLSPDRHAIWKEVKLEFAPSL